MKVFVFTLRYDRLTEQFDDRALRDFMATGAEVVELREHFFECDGAPAWALLLSYRDNTDVAPLQPRRNNVMGGDNKAALSADEMVRFEAARAWRNARATREGKPPYVLLTNRQLASVAKQNPNNLNSLGEIPGIGEGKLQDFGNELLAILAATQMLSTTQEMPTSHANP